MDVWDWRDAAGGACGALALTLAGTPFDVVKLRLQLSAPSTSPVSGAGALGVARALVRSEGLLALWRGAGPAFASAAIENVVVFAARGALTRAAAVSWGCDPLPLLAHVCIGGASGVLSAIAICPAEVLKCRLQAARAAGAPTTAAAALAALLAERGVARGLFAGLTPLLARDVPFNALFFGSYRTACAAAAGALGTGPDEPPTPAVAFACGGLAGMAAWSVVFPLDTLKSHMQAGAGGAGAGQTLRALLAAGGAARLYRGFTAAVARAFPANAALLWGVETAQAVLR
jgi:hypothetical protein